MVAERHPVVGCNISEHPSCLHHLWVPPGRQARGFDEGQHSFGAGANRPSV